METILDYAGVAVFAATGALAASRKQLDIVGFLFFAAVTGIGGGTLRDILLGKYPVFWVSNPNYVIVTIGVGVLLYFTAPLVEYRYRLLLWLDAVGLAAYCVIGAERGLDAGAPGLVAVVTGVVTATFGGLLRDIISGEPSVLLRREIYITAALAGAAAYAGLRAAGIDPALGAGISALLAFAIRGGAIGFGWTLPGYRGRPGRPADSA
jgi:uncharacterized membrane protein YeiH